MTTRFTGNGVVVDTSVVSYIFKDDHIGRYYEEQVKIRRTFISFQTLEELRFGVAKRNWGEKQENALYKHLEQYQVVWPNRELVGICAALRVERERAGKPLATADAWIAATAILLDCPLVSHDHGFRNIPNLKLIQKP